MNACVSSAIVARFVIDRLRAPNPNDCTGAWLQKASDSPYETIEGASGRDSRNKSPAWLQFKPPGEGELITGLQWIPRPIWRCGCSAPDLGNSKCPKSLKLKTGKDEANPASKGEQKNVSWATKYHWARKVPSFYSRFCHGPHLD